MTLFYALGTLALVLGGLGVALRRARRRAIGPAAVGMFFEMMSHDRRQAVEMVVEDKAEERDSEHADGMPQATTTVKKR